MTDQTRRECIRALALGMTENQIMRGLGVTAEELHSIAESEVDDEKAYLKEMGRIQCL